MRKLVILLLCLTINLFGFAQIITDADEISPFHENLAAIKKNNQWAFINAKGEIIIDFNDDIILSVNESNKVYPFFKDGRCLIMKTIDGIDLYGYIDTTGKEVIAPQFVKASNFTNGYAIVVKYEKHEIGQNSVLGKKVVSFNLDEYVIDTSGAIVKFLNNTKKISLKNLRDKNIPRFESKFIGPNLVAVKHKNGKWNLYGF